MEPVRRNQSGGKPPHSKFSRSGAGQGLAQTAGLCDEPFEARGARAGAEALAAEDKVREIRPGPGLVEFGAGLR